MIQKTDNWLETRWHVSRIELEPFLALLDQMGSLGNYEEMNLDPEIENQKTISEIKAYFADRDDVSGFQNHLKTFETPHIHLKDINRIPYGEWATAWKEYFHPFHLTNDIVIRPSWEDYTAKPEEKVITLDPGMAFGTGQHDTTKFCAEFLSEHLPHNPCHSLLDVGCGSGILSFIARKYNVPKVTGIDIEEPAIETCIENLERNPDLSPITFLKTNGELTDVVNNQFEIVVANIIAEALCDLKTTLVGLVKPQGLLILSGILPIRESLVKDTFSDLKLLSEKTSESWHTYLYQV